MCAPDMSGTRAMTAVFMNIIQQKMKRVYLYFSYLRKTSIIHFEYIPELVKLATGQFITPII